MKLSRTLSLHLCTTLSAAFFLFAPSTADAADILNELWTGSYAGGQLGYIQATGSDADLCGTTFGPRLCISNPDPSGFSADMGNTDAHGTAAGGYLGYSYRLSSLVAGLEADANLDHAQSHINVSDKYAFDSEMNWDVSLRVRLGLVVQERALVYVTAGPSLVASRVDLTSFLGSDACNDPALTSKCGDNQINFGWQFGVGSEYFLTERLSMKAEYLHGWYGESDMNLIVASDGVSTFDLGVRQNLQTNVARIGISYHFNSF